jgi:hypothetical protein
VRYETVTRMKREDVFEAAKRFFGQEEGGLGMKLGAEQGTQIQFFGDGLIWITVWPGEEGKPVRVDIDVSDRDADAKAFIEKVLRAPVAAFSKD